MIVWSCAFLLFILRCGFLKYFLGFSLHYSCKWYRIRLKVVKSGTKWFKVADKSLFVAGHFFIGESAVYSVTCGQGDCTCSWENTITQSTRRAD